MKRTNKGYETKNYFVNRHMTRNIWTYKPVLYCWDVINKETGEKEYAADVHLKEIKQWLTRRGELV